MAETDEILESERDADESPEELEGGPVEELDSETRARRDSALSRVRKLGDPVLRASALPVDRFDETLRAEIERMGVLHRVLVYRVDPEEELTVLVNPVLEWSSEETETASEGCLSIPFVHVDVERPAEVRVRARDGYGADLEVQGSGLTARVIQHEMDHLDGVLMIDRISRAERKEAMRAMREAQRQASEAPGADRATRDAGDAADADEEPVAGEA